ncbi:hypothetical protein BOX15_Mlig006485g1 [Macrostomum lignano]|uniref:Uncharacterized protein n=1 Tax=Macrostomum lignano TaxID=282301 RepID=A0A267G2V0_9PLAT|nr:hypothetical protein BOX15_Mlig006485g1 [Macrostomum lignano]
MDQSRDGSSEFASELQRLGSHLAGLPPEAAAAFRAAICRLSAATGASTEASLVAEPLPPEPSALQLPPQQPLPPQPPKQQPLPPQAPKQQPLSPQPPKQQPLSPQPPKQQPLSPQPPKQQPLSPQPPKQQPLSPQPPKQQPLPPQPTKQQPLPPQPPKQQPLSPQPPKQQPLPPQPPKQQPLSPQPQKQQPLPPQPPKQQPQPPPSQDQWVPLLVITNSELFCTDWESSELPTSCSSCEPDRSRQLIRPVDSAVGESPSGQTAPKSVPASIPLGPSGPIVLAPLSVCTRFSLASASLDAASPISEASQNDSQIPTTALTLLTQSSKTPSELMPAPSPSQQPASALPPPPLQPPSRSSTMPPPISESLNAQPPPLPQPPALPHRQSASTTASSVGSYNFLALLLDQLTPPIGSEESRSIGSSKQSRSPSSGSGGVRRNPVSSGGSSGGRDSCAEIDRRSAWTLGGDLEDVHTCDLADEYDELRAVVRHP